MTRLGQRSSRFYRVDPRLVHATLMNAWVPYLGAQQIVVVSDDVVVDPRVRTILEMSAMEAALSFTREEDARAVLARIPPLTPAIVLFSSLASAERAINAGLDVDALNIGHLPEGAGRWPILPAVHLGSADLGIVRRLERRGIEVYIQPLPRDPRMPAPPDPTMPEIASEAPGGSGPRARAPSLVPRAVSVPRGASTAGSAAERVEAKLRVVNERGLHLRAAHALAHLAAGLAQNVQVSNGPDFVNAKSLLGLTTLGATYGTVLDVVVTGQGATEALEKIAAMFAGGFGEGVKEGSGDLPASPTDSPDAEGTG